MKHFRNIFFATLTIGATLLLGACGSLEDETSIWNQTRDAVADAGNGEAVGGAQFTPGTFEATGEVRGYGGFISVVVTVDDSGAISDIEVTEHQESPGFDERAFDAIIPQIIASGSTTVDMDAASGATLSANALIDAVRVALAQAGGEQVGVPSEAAGGDLTPGTFEATGEVRGYGGFISVSVTVGDNGAISSIEVTDHQESPGFDERAFDAIIPLIKSAGNENVDIDAASGATLSANALIDAVRVALDQAR